jgi:hypothetical protein
LAFRHRTKVFEAIVDPMPTPHELAETLRDRLDALGPARRAELLHVLMLPGYRADRIGAYLGNPGIRVERGDAQVRAATEVILLGSSR